MSTRSSMDAGEGGLTFTCKLDDLSDADLIKTVDDLKNDMKRMELENQIFENFLLANEPTIIAGMAQTLESAWIMQSQLQAPVPASAQPEPVPVAEVKDQQSDQQSLHKNLSSRSRVTSIGTSHGTVPERGPRINLSQKTDLVLREIEEMQISLEKFINKSHRKKCRLKAEIEESSIRNIEVKEAKDIFEQSIVIDAVDKLTQKIPAEKFVRYLHEWLKSAQFTLEKLRLRTSSIKIQQAKLKTVLTQKAELGESVHVVDFEKLRIENKHLLLKIEQKNHHLLELKRMNGKANLMLTNHKKVLQKQGDELHNIRRAIEHSQKIINELEAEADIAEQEVEKEQEKFDQLKKLVKNFRVPDVMEYINKKAELYEIKKVLKTWTRKCTIQKIAIDTYTRNMTYVTGIKKPRPSWFEIDRKYSDDAFTDDSVSGCSSSSACVSTPKSDFS